MSHESNWRKGAKGTRAKDLNNYHFFLVLGRIFFHSQRLFVARRVSDLKNTKKRIIHESLLTSVVCSPAQSKCLRRCPPSIQSKLREPSPHRVPVAHKHRATLSKFIQRPRARLDPEHV